MHSYHFINDSHFLISTFNVKEILTRFPLLIVLNSLIAFEKSYFKLLLPNKLQITQDGQKHFCEIDLIKFKENSKETKENSSCNCCSSKLVEKLDLTTKPHPKSYKLEWIKDDSGIRVKDQFNIPISIGNFDESFLCYIVAMETKHTLLGRP